MAKNNPSVSPKDIQLQKVNVLQFKIEASEKYIQKPLKPKNINFELGKEIAHNLEKGVARYRLFFNCKAENSKNKSIGLEANIGLEFHFAIEDFNRFIIKHKNGTVQIHLSIITNLMNIAYATSRGIILEKTQNSYFNGIIIPIVDSTGYLIKNEQVLIGTDL